MIFAVDYLEELESIFENDLVSRGLDADLLQILKSERSHQRQCARKKDFLFKLGFYYQHKFDQKINSHAY